MGSSETNARRSRLPYGYRGGDRCVIEDRLLLYDAAHKGFCRVEHSFQDIARTGLVPVHPTSSSRFWMVTTPSFVCLPPNGDTSASKELVVSSAWSEANQRKFYASPSCCGTPPALQICLSIKEHKSACQFIQQLLEVTCTNCGWRHVDLDKQLRCAHVIKPRL